MRLSAWAVRRISLQLSFLLGTAVACFAQWEVGIAAGVSTYTGELSPVQLTGHFKTLGFSYGAHVRYQANDFIALRLNYQDLDIFGDDAGRPSARERNLSFYSDVDELALLVEVYPFRTTGRVSPYLIGGFAAYRFNPVTYFQDVAYELQPLGTEGQGLPGFADRYSLTETAVPLGGGLRIHLAGPWTISFEGIGRILFTDYIDDISGKYVDEAVLAGNGPLAVSLAFRGDELPGAEPGLSSPAGSLRGSPGVNDYYYSGMATISYDLGSLGRGGRGNSRSSSRKVKCPTF